MNKAVVAIIAALAIITGVSYYYITKCTEPSEMQVQISTLICAQSLDEQEIFTEACQKLHGQEYPCEFALEDREGLMKIVTTKLNACIDKDMESQNLCTDKIKRF